MDRLKNNQGGFSTIEVILVVVVVALIGLVGWLVYKSPPRASSLSSVSTSLNRPSTPTQPEGYYARWNQYCDTEGKACFKYPPNWTLNENKEVVSSTVNNVSSTVQSPDQAVNISYAYPYVRDAAITSFLTMSIDNIPNYPNLKIVGGIYIDNNNFSLYAIVDASLVSQDGLAVGHTSQFINTPRFGLTTDTTNEPYQLVAIDGLSNGNNTLDAAKNWFTSPEAKDGLLILQSFTIQ